MRSLVLSKSGPLLSEFKGSRNSLLQVSSQVDVEKGSGETKFMSENDSPQSKVTRQVLGPFAELAGQVSFNANFARNNLQMGCTASTTRFRTRIPKEFDSGSIQGCVVGGIN